MPTSFNTSRTLLAGLAGVALAFSILGCARKTVEESDHRAYTEAHAPKESLDVAKQPDMMARGTKCSSVPDRCCTSSGFCCTWSGKGSPICH
jgi:hypothetical protein